MSIIDKLKTLGIIKYSDLLGYETIVIEETADTVAEISPEVFMERFGDIIEDDTNYPPGKKMDFIAERTALEHKLRKLLRDPEVSDTDKAIIREIILTHKDKGKPDRVRDLLADVETRIPAIKGKIADYEKDPKAPTGWDRIIKKWREEGIEF